MDALDSNSNDIIIIGGGIQGTSIAYYLMKRGAKCTIIEESAIAVAASGKAGGFLARNWGSAETNDMHQLSYELHAQLAEELSLESYRQLPTMHVSTGSRSNKRKLDSEVAVSWIETTHVAECKDAVADTAQVCPLELTTKLAAAVQTFGSTILFGPVSKVCTDESGCVSGVRYTPVAAGPSNGEEVTLAAKRVVVATGPWAGVHAADWLGIHIPMQGIKSTSMVYKNSPDHAVVLDEPRALFCAEDDNGCHLEVYPRNNGDVYVCGCGGSEIVDESQLRSGGAACRASLVQPNTTRAHAAARSFSALSSLGGRWADVTQACLRPITADGLPVMGAINGHGCQGAYICAGHNCWGILWGPISGLCMSEVILTGSSNVLDMSPFRPERFT